MPDLQPDARISVVACSASSPYDGGGAYGTGGFGKPDQFHVADVQQHFFAGELRLEVAQVGEAGELVDAVWVVASCGSRGSGDGGGGHVAGVGLFGFFVVQDDDIDKTRVVGVDGD